MDKEQKKYQSFYCSKDWHDRREVVIFNCYGIDIVEYYRTGQVIQGNVVHHIECLDECWDSRLSISNLIYVTDRTHRNIHMQYNKGEKEKKEMKRMLIELKEKFMEEFI